MARIQYTWREAPDLLQPLAHKPLVSLSFGIPDLLQRLAHKPLVLLSFSIPGLGAAVRARISVATQSGAPDSVGAKPANPDNLKNPRAA